jgi:hypothetical protein
MEQVTRKQRAGQHKGCPYTPLPGPRVGAAFMLPCASRKTLPNMFRDSTLVTNKNFCSQGTRHKAIAHP